MASDGLNTPRGSKEGDGDSIYPNKHNLRKTHALVVTGQKLTDVPESVFKMAFEESANIVDFSRNYLPTLPSGLQNMRQCATEVIFANNVIESIPVFLSEFTRLFLVDLSCNFLSDLPEEFGRLSTLRELKISNNRFTSLPKCIYQLHSLEILHAHDNRITEIDASPTGLRALTRLATLDLRNNSIEHVPPVLGKMNHITALDIVGNLFRQPRQQVLEKGTDAIMAYLRDRIPAESS